MFFCCCLSSNRIGLDCLKRIPPKMDIVLPCYTYIWWRKNIPNSFLFHRCLMLKHGSNYQAANFLDGAVWHALRSFLALCISTALKIIFGLDLICSLESPGILLYSNWKDVYNVDICCAIKWSCLKPLRRFWIVFKCWVLHCFFNGFFFFFNGVEFCIVNCYLKS